MNVRDIIKKTLIFVSETFFPAPAMTKRLEKMSLEEFLNEIDILSKDREIKGINILFEYHNNLVHHAIHALKFKGNSLIAKLLAQALYENILEDLGDKGCLENFESPILIPMPSSRERLRERGWNQCELVSRELALLDHNTNFTIDTKILSKNKYTESQIGKTRTERLHNLAGSFSVRNKNKIAGKNIILLDDVVTTGATMSEAKKALLDAGARKVWCVALAH